MITIARARPSCRRLLRNADGLERRCRAIFLWNNNKKKLVYYILLLLFTYPVAFDVALYSRKRVRLQILVE